jgi:acetoacetyl-CoA reductase
MTKRVAVVTGGIGGLGTAICISLARDGRTVVAADLGGDPARITGFEQDVQGLDIRFAQLDVSSFEACGAFVRDVENEHGALDILVNNAGITRDSTLRKMSPEQWQSLLDVNLSSAFNLCRHAIDGMIGRGFGRIVNISSVSGQTGNFGQANYAAAKAGLIGAVRALSLECAPRGVTVNAVAPGLIDSPAVAAAVPAARVKEMVPARRLGTPEEVANLVAFLCSDRAAYITGQTVSINGGMA